jgi:hypothetical protein
MIGEISVNQGPDNASRSAAASARRAGPAGGAGGGPVVEPKDPRTIPGEVNA